MPYDACNGTIDREKDADRVCFLVQERMLHVEESAQRTTALLLHSSRAGEGWSKGGWHVGNRRKSRRDLDNHGLPSG